MNEFFELLRTTKIKISRTEIETEMTSILSEDLKSKYYLRTKPIADWNKNDIEKWASEIFRLLLKGRDINFIKKDQIEALAIINRAIKLIRGFGFSYS